jgi:lipopolysaccharide export system protein LptA
MKKSFIILSILFLFSIISLSAHPASSVSASFDKEQSTLSISFKHQVKNNADHFVSEVVVLKNKKEIISQKLTYQDTSDGGALVYKINDLKPKDKLEIVTTCNKIGKKSQTLEIK